ncbi:MAG: response regulator [Eubacteriales bacterium]|nr:response regulator [Eubacteriales bacterium]
MYKVVIADDEERICKLIEALVDWASLGLEVAATAHNGVEALDLIRRHKPEILITDIRMPGCSGLELIRTAKELLPNLEIIIISGYAHFEYAQQAIQYSVGDYLLKPVSRQELCSTLQKLSGRIRKRYSTDLAIHRLRQDAEENDQLLMQRLILDLIEQKESPSSVEFLAKTFSDLPPRTLCQAVRIKMDLGKEALQPASIDVLMQKALSTVTRILDQHCVRLHLCIHELSCVGFLCFEDTQSEALRRDLRNILSQLEAQRSLFQSISFSAALGSAVRDPAQLPLSMQEAGVIIQERLLKGCGRIYEKAAAASGILHSGIQEQYLRLISSAVDTLNVNGIRPSVELLRDAVLSQKSIRGQEVFDLVISAADLFAMKAKLADRAEFNRQFQNLCLQRGSADELFMLLISRLEECLTEISEQRESDSVRPIRLAKQYIQEHYAEQITQEEVSRHVGLTPAYFSTLFKKTEQEGFARYLIRIRIEAAKHLLRETSFSVSEICQQVGYHDPKHFTHTFEKETGVKPTLYRKLYG